MRSISRDTTDLLRGAGAVMVAAGSAVLFVRKASGHAWGDVALLLVVLAPALLLYRLAIVGADREGDASRASSRSVTMIAAILLAPLVIVEALHVLGADTGKPLYTALAFALTGLIAAYGAARARVPYAALLAGLVLLVTWLIVWAQILDHPSASAFRALLVAGAALLLLTAIALQRRRAIGAGEVVTAAGVAAVAAGVLGVFVGAFAGLAQPLAILSSHGQAGAPDILGVAHPNGSQSFGWDLYLLVVSLGLIAVGARARSRGLGYVGGFGALMFVNSVALEVTRIASGKAFTASLVGWPLALLVLGLAGLAAPAFARRES